MLCNLREKSAMMSGGQETANQDQPVDNRAADPHDESQSWSTFVSPCTSMPKDLRGFLTVGNCYGQV